MSFRLVPKSVTLNGIMALFCDVSANSCSFQVHCVKVHVHYLISWWVLVLKYYCSKLLKLCYILFFYRSATVGVCCSTQDDAVSSVWAGADVVDAAWCLSGNHQPHTSWHAARLSVHATPRHSAARRPRLRFPRMSLHFISASAYFSSTDTAEPWPVLSGNIF